MRIDRERAEAAFAAYTSTFETSDPKIALKIEHTHRVATLCECIATSEGVPARTANLAWLAGMLHDLGRFEQIRTFNTFTDALSVNHATLSAMLAFDEGLIAEFADVDKADVLELRMLRTAIEQHSAWRLPSDLDPQTRTLCDILRDADKIDIMGVNCMYPVEIIYPFSEAELNASALTPEVVAAFNRRGTVPTRLKKLPADYALGHCAFGWELVFAESKQLAVQQGYLASLFDRPYILPATRKTFALAKHDMLSWLAKEC